jgi:lysophospholipase L1-like esterase
MKLSFEMIRSATAGAVRMSEENGEIRFFRFSEEQTEMYQGVSKDFHKKTYATAGVKIKFKTDSSSLSMTVKAFSGSSRSFFDHDIVINGELKYTLSGDLKEGDAIVPKTVSGTYDLGDGEKTVCIYFPWSADSRILSFELDDGASFEPVPFKHRVLTFGDSITHGYDATHPSLSYASLVADYLDANAVNKGIGGEVFRPALCAIKENFEPDIITVAYGTNDWSLTDTETFEKNSEEFYTTLARLYPNAKIISLAPLWRVDCLKQTKIGPFENIAKKFFEIEKKIPNMTVIDCFEFLPQEATMFSDLKIHPSNEGFDYYAKGVIKALEKMNIK